MKIMFNLDKCDGWIRAAQYLNLEACKLNSSRIFDSLAFFKPNLLITHNINDELKKALFKYKCSCLLLTNYLPAADFPPNFSGGEYKQEYDCDLLILGNYKEEYKKYLVQLNLNNIKYKILGTGNWNVPEHVGSISSNEIADAYKSAKYSVDFDGDESRVLAISISGGKPISAGKWHIGINDLDTCPYFEDEYDLIKVLKTKPEFFSKDTPILMDRLKELLEKIA